MGEWTQEEQDRAVQFRREVSADMQQYRREGHHFFAWVMGKLADMALWIEREGKRLRRGF